MSQNIGKPSHPNAVLACGIHVLCSCKMCGHNPLYLISLLSLDTF
uniref:Uncharacterized protein n=1 Tax=Setaria italica TaxID=4555 RepID=K3Z1A0_SETIT